MRSTGVVVLGLLLSSFAVSQTSPPALQMQPPTLIPPPAAQAPEAPSVSNYSIMLVNPTGGAVVLMHNPQNALEYVDVSRTKEAFSAGYVPARAGEIGDLITALKDEIARLSAENTRLQNGQARQVVVVPNTQAPSQVEIEARDRALKRQQLINAWLTVQSINRQTPYRPTPYYPPVLPTNRFQTNCTSTRLGDTVTTNCN